MTDRHTVSTRVLLALYRKMVEIRLFEERVAELHALRELPEAWPHFPGGEAVPAAIALALEESDCIQTDHQHHGFYLAAGGDMSVLMSAVRNGAGGGSSLTDPETWTEPAACEELVEQTGFATQENLVLPSAVESPQTLETDAPPDRNHTQLDNAGNELPQTDTVTPRLTFRCFTDRARAVGQWRSWRDDLNAAARERLPVVFLCRTAFSPEATDAEPRIPADWRAAARELRLSMIPVDGHSAEAIYRVAARAIELARRGNGPLLLLCRMWHLPQPYRLNRQPLVARHRTREQLAAVRHDPLERLQLALRNRGLSEQSLYNLQDDVDLAVTSAVASARREQDPSHHPLAESHTRAA